MKKKLLLIAIVTITILIAIAFFLWQTLTPKQEYESDFVALRNIQKTINVNATLQPEIYTDISTEIPAIIEWVGVKTNDSVMKNQEILRLDKDSIEAQIKNAQLAVERAELAEQQGRSKSSNLNSKEILSLKKASEQARQTLNEVYAQAKKTSISSTIDGVVIEQNANIGEVASGILIRIIDPKSLRIEALIPEVDISKIQVGNITHTIFDAYPEKTIEGRVKAIEMGNINLQNNTYYKAIIAIDNTDNIMVLNGMNAEIDIEYENRNEAISIPRVFAMKDERGYFAYILNSPNKNEATPTKQYFETGLIGDKNIEILSGLSEGQNVVQFIDMNK